MRRILFISMAVAFAVAAVTTPASAQCSPNAGPFCIDGTIPDPATGTAVADPNGSTKELGPVNGSITKIGVINTAAVPMLEFTNPNASVDLNLVYLSAKKDLTTGHVWLYFAWFRDSVNGSGFVSLEGNKAASDCTYPITTKDACNPWKNRADGDPLFSWDQQGGSRDIYLRVFSASKPGFITPTNCIGLVKDLGCLLDPTVARAEYNASGSGGELAVDLTSLFNLDPNACTIFGNVIPGTVTGNSDTADYKDVVLEPLSVTLCGILTVEKVTRNAAGQVFADPADPTFQYTLGGPTSAVQNIKAGAANKITHDPVLPGDYTLVESAIASGYTLVSIVCGGQTLDTATETFPVVAGVTTACVITNRKNPTDPTPVTIQYVALRDRAEISGIARFAGDNPGEFVVTFRLYDSLAACQADTARTAGLAFVRTLTLTVPTAGFAETHPEGQGVQKPNGTYFWWMRFSGNSVNGLVVNNPVIKGCGSESTTFSFSYQ